MFPMPLKEQGHKSGLKMRKLKEKDHVKISIGLNHDVSRKKYHDHKEVRVAKDVTSSF